MVLLFKRRDLFICASINQEERDIKPIRNVNCSELEKVLGQLCLQSFALLFLLFKRHDFFYLSISKSRRERYKTNKERKLSRTRKSLTSGMFTLPCSPEGTKYVQCSANARPSTSVVSNKTGKSISCSPGHRTRKKIIVPRVLAESLCIHFGKSAHLQGNCKKKLYW